MWLTQALADVAWIPYEQAMNHLTETERIFVVKFSHRWLATATRQKREGAESDQCILCNDQEDFYHLYKCKQRQKWRTKFFNDLREEMNTLDTAPDIEDAIMTNLKAWMTDDDIEESPQDKIGWTAFIRGYMSSHWVDGQEIYYRRHAHKNGINTATYKHTGQYWAKHMIDFLWRQGRSLWKERSAQVHEPDEEGTHNPVDRRDLQHKIRQLYLSENAVRAADKRNFFSKTVEEVIKGPTRSLRAWITTYEPAIKRAIRDEAIHSRTGYKDIRDYMLERELKPD